MKIVSLNRSVRGLAMCAAAATTALPGRATRALLAAKITLVASLLVATTPSYSATYNWLGNTLTGTWNTVGATGWDGGPPNALGDVAQRVTALTANVDITQSLNNVTVGNVIVGNGVGLGDFYFEMDFGTGRVLNLNNSGAGANVQWNSPTSGSQTQLWFGGAGTINLQDNLKVNVVSASNITTARGTVVFEVPITGTGNLTVNSAQAIPSFGIGSSGQVQAGASLGKANTFVGTTTIERGAVQFLTSTSFGSSANTINLGVSGSDSAAMISGGTLTLANPIVVASGNTGTLTIDNPSSSVSVIATYSGSITLGSTLNIVSRSTAENQIFTGALSGSGGVIFPSGIDNNGRTSFRGANTYAGDTVINGQTLIVRNGSAIPNGAGTGNVSIGAAGTLVLIGNETINGLSGSGTITSGTSTATLTLGDNGASGTFSGSILPGTGTAIAKIGGGTQSLSGTNTYAGTTTVNAGKLLVNGANSGGGAYSVASGATLGGTGGVGASVVTVDAGGLLAPGASIESLDVGGAVINGNFGVEYQGAVGAGNDLIDLLNVAGGLNIANATLNLASLGGTLDDSVLIFAKYGSLTGTQFASVSGLLPANYAINYAYNDGVSSNNIALVQVPEPCATALFGIGFLGAATCGRRRVNSRSNCDRPHIVQ